MVLLVGAPTAAEAADGSDILIGADPGPGAVVAASPGRITLDFAEPVEAGSLRIFDGGGVERAIVVEAAAGSEVVGTPELLDSGRYLLAWQVTTETSGVLTGAYTFAVDPTLTGAVVIERGIAESEGAATARKLGVGMAAFGWILLAGTVLAAAIAPSRAPRSALGWAGALMAGGAALAFLGTGGSGWSNLTATMDTAAGRAFLVVLAAALAVPYLVLQWRAERAAPAGVDWRLFAGAAVALSAAGLMVGLDAEGIPLLLGAAVGLVSAASVTAVMLQRWAVAAVGAVVGVALAVATVSETREYGFTYRDDLGPVIVEVAVEPAQRGVNELHLYGFDPGGGLAQLTEATARATHLPTGVGPVEIPLLRAGPNHFLTYGAELPLPGTWEIDMRTATAESPNLETTAIVELR
jgi:methionine-rich copper-binding protein CopC